MAYLMKSLVCNKIVQALEGFPIGGRGLKPSQFASAVRLCPNNGLAIEYDIRLSDELKPVNVCGTSTNIPMEASEFVAKFPTDATVYGVYMHVNQKPGTVVKFKVCNKKFVNETLDVVCNKPHNFWISSPIFKSIQKENVIVEFSSPNIAKPFHLGNLKSTIVGNFVSQLFEAVGHKVTCINYLGDWGTQFGLLKYGYDAQNMSEKDLETQPIQTLCRLYVWANEEANKNPEIREVAKNIFRRMEAGDEVILKSWKLFRDITIKELIEVYKKFNIIFDSYHGESMYNLLKCNDVLNKMTEIGVLKSSPDGQRYYQPSKEHRQITIIKSDGSSLYLTRDIAAAVHRYETLKFDRMYYVVDSAQNDHFKALFGILGDLGFEWAKNLTHISFGRIHGMSTRKGTAVSLQDILDEGVLLSLSQQQKAKYTPEDASFDDRGTAESLVVSDLIAYGLKLRRSTNTPFNWKEILQKGKGIGTKFQYVHCRLLRMEESCGIKFNPDVNPEFLQEPEVIDLVRILARFDEVLLAAYESVESSVFLDYLNGLSYAATAAYRKLPVKNTPQHVAEARLKLFRASRYTLASGMKILGLSPLNRM